MMGMSLGPVTGRLIAEILAGETPPIDLALLSPDRYAGADASSRSRPARSPAHD